MSRPAPVLEDGQVWAPGDAVGKALGVTLTPDGQVFRIKGGDGTAPRKVVDGREMVSLRPLAEALGAQTRLDKNTLGVFARVTDVRFTDGALRITTSFPVIHQTRRLTAPERIYVASSGRRPSRSPPRPSSGRSGSGSTIRTPPASRQRRPEGPSSR